VNLEALIFDFDGTIADTEETHRQAFNDTFMRFGLGWEWTKPAYRELLKVSGGQERIVAYITTLPLAAAERERLIALAPSLHRAKAALYNELIADGRCLPRPGVTRLFAEAREAGLKLAIASTSATANVEALITRHLGRSALSQFRTMVCSDLVAHKKPAPDIYRLALATLGLGADACAAIEDSLNGVRAAKAAGLFTIVTPSQWTEGEDFGAADIVLPYLGDREHPLPPALAGSLGAPWLSIRHIAARLAEV
jgi:HAD superfamily hydrolase (TIGR01509 family)